MWKQWRSSASFLLLSAWLPVGTLSLPLLHPPSMLSCLCVSFSFYTGGTRPLFDLHIATCLSCGTHTHTHRHTLTHTYPQVNRAWSKKKTRKKCIKQATKRDKISGKIADKQTSLYPLPLSCPLRAQQDHQQCKNIYKKQNKNICHTEQRKLSDQRLRLPLSRSLPRGACDKWQFCLFAALRCAEAGRWGTLCWLWSQRSAGHLIWPMLLLFAPLLWPQGVIIAALSVYTHF